MKLRTLSCLALFTVACAARPADSDARHGAGSASITPAAQETAAPAQPATPRPSVELQAGAHQAAMHEVALSPDGQAALTLDTAGGVRLWSSFDEGAEPWLLPIREPSWMSIAATGDGYLAAFVDTSGGSWVAKVSVGEEGAVWTRAFEVPPMDPIFELHVLAGGQRILALGVDHRVRLWDADGRTLSELDQHGVIPWQLRVGHDADGTPHAAVVQFGPVRVQRLSLEDDALALVGEAQLVAIDQSPNRNDIGMSPDGRYVTAMQKRESKSARFEVEIIDLEDGTRRMLAADSDARFRPRILPQASEVIAETGTGSALRLPLERAVPWAPGMDRDALVAVSADTLAIAGSSEDTLMHAAAQSGVHAVASADTLHVQDLHSQVRTSLEHTRLLPTAVALNPSGTTVAWASASGIVVESVDGERESLRLSAPEGNLQLLAFVGDQHLVSVDDDGQVRILEIAEDMVVDTVKLPVAWGIARIGWRPSPEGGSVVLGATKPDAPLQVLTVRAGSFGPREQVRRSERSQWPEAGKPPRAESKEWMAALGHGLDSLGLRPGEVVATTPNPEGTRLMVVQRENGWSGNAFLTMIDAETGKRLWVRRAHRLGGMAWSNDGSRFAYADSRGGTTCDAQTGDAVLRR